MTSDSTPWEEGAPTHVEIPEDGLEGEVGPVGELAKGRGHSAGQQMSFRLGQQAARTGS